MQLCPAPCEIEYYSSVIIHHDNQTIWNTHGKFSSDYVLGICCIALPMFEFRYQITLTPVNTSKPDIVLTSIKDLNKIGGYVSHEHASTYEALENVDEERTGNELRRISPDDGTDAAWVFNNTDKDDTYWNLIMFDCARDFLTGFQLFCDSFQRDMWGYILGDPIGSEGSVSKWDDIKDSCNNEEMYEWMNKMISEGKVIFFLNGFGISLR